MNQSEYTKQHSRIPINFLTMAIINHVHIKHNNIIIENLLEHFASEYHKNHNDITDY